MEERKEAKYNLYGACAECGKQIKIELTIATELMEKETETEPEGKDDGTDTKREGTDNNEPEVPGVRPDSTEGEPTAGTGADKPADTKKAAGNKKAGWKAK